VNTILADGIDGRVRPVGNYVFIAASLDGFIAGPGDSMEWLGEVPAQDGEDYGYGEFVKNMDAVLMGRNTFEFVRRFKPWPYAIPVFVASTSLSREDAGVGNRVSVINGHPRELVAELNALGYKNLYIDGGKTIQGFLEQDLIDEMTVTRIPVLLGEGTPLFGKTGRPLRFRHITTVIYGNGLVKSIYGKI
jgi:dihydrofolate reductase